MADINALTYFVYSLMTLASHEAPITDPAVRAWQPEPPVNEAWNQEPYDYTVKSWQTEPPVNEAWDEEPYDYTVKYEEQSCPSDEEYSDCDAGCQKTCENVGEDKVCPQMCVPGCVCREPGTVRGPNGKCIHPPLCPSADDSPVTRYGEEDTDFPAAYTNDPPINEDASRFVWTLPDYPYSDRRRETVQPFDERDPKYLPSRRVTKVDPDEIEPYTISPRGLDGKCSSTEVMSCEKGCERNCSNWERPNMCPKWCIPGCVCKKDLVRGPDRKCIKPETCPRESKVIHQEPQPGILRANHGCPNNDACTQYCKKNRGKPIGSCQGMQLMECLCFEHW